MSDLNRLKVVDFTAGRLSSDDINTDIPFADNFDKTRTIQQANAVIGAYVNRNYKDMQNKADIDDIPTKTSQLENDSGYITTGDIPSKTSDLINDGADGEHPFITNQVDDLVNYTDNNTLSIELGDIYGEINDTNTDVSNLQTAIDLQLPNRVGDLVVDSVRSKNMLSINNIIEGLYKIGDGTYEYTNANCCTGSKIEIDNTKNYVLSVENTQNDYMYVMFYNNVKTYLGYISVPLSTGVLQLNTFNNYSNAKYVNFRFDVDPSNLIKPMLEVGNSKTTYKQYQNLNGLDIYSNNELIIGYYLGKPLYRKVLDTTSYATSYNISINNIDKIIKMSGMVKRSDYDIWQFIPSRLDNASFSTQFGNAQYNPTSLTVNISFGTAWSSSFSRLIVILEYTKTTD